MTSELTLPVGYSCRPVTMADLETVVSFLNLCSIHDIGVPDETPDTLKNFWESPGFDMATSTMAVFDPHGQIIGYCNVSDAMPVPVHPWVWLRIHPQNSEPAIGPALLAWGETRACQAILRVPHDARVAMRSSTVNTAVSQKQLLENYGFTLVRHFWRMAMELDKEPPTPQWPQGITLRTYADYPDMRAIFHALEEGFEDHWGQVPQPEDQAFERFQHFLTTYEGYDPKLVYVAMDGDEIAAVNVCVTCVEDDPDMGWVDDLSVRRPWRRKGLALALLHHCFGEFYQRGKKRVGLGVDTQNLTGATRLYERAGMHPSRQWDTYEKELRPGRDLSKQTLAE